MKAVIVVKNGCVEWPELEFTDLSIMTIKWFKLFNGKFEIELNPNPKGEYKFVGETQGLYWIKLPNDFTTVVCKGPLDTLFPGDKFGKYDIKVRKVK